MHVLVDGLHFFVLVRVNFFEGFFDLECIVGLRLFLPRLLLLLDTRGYFDGFDLSICVCDVLCLQLELALLLFFDLAAEIVHIVAF